MKTNKRASYYESFGAPFPGHIHLMKPRQTMVSIRRASLLFAGLFGVMALFIVGALIWTSNLLNAATEEVIRDTRSMEIASELEVSLLSHQRISNLFMLRKEPEIGKKRDALGTEMRDLVKQASEHTNERKEAQLLDELDASLQSYLASRQLLESQDLALVEIIQRVRPIVSDTINLLETLRALNAQQVDDAYEQSKRVALFADLSGAAAGIFILLGLLGLIAATRAYMLKPLFGLHDSIISFRDGNMNARAPELGPQETLEIAQAFNEMATTLQDQQTERLSFLAGVAHDLRNPLGGLKIGVQTLRRAGAPDQRERTLDLLERQVDRLARMIDDLLETTQIEAGQLELNVATFDLRDSLADIVELYQPTSPDHQLIVETPARPIIVDGDILRIEQVLGNLVSNAIKFSPDGGQIEISLEVNNGEALVSVSDPGIGIAADDFPQLFMPFSRIKPGVAPGAGLGLSVVQRILRAHAGTIEVDSEPGAGSTFTVHLPRRLDQPEQTVA